MAHVVVGVIDTLGSQAEKVRFLSESRISIHRSKIDHQRPFDLPTLRHRHPWRHRYYWYSQTQLVHMRGARRENPPDASTLTCGNNVLLCIKSEENGRMIEESALLARLARLSNDLPMTYLVVDWCVGAPPVPRGWNYDSYSLRLQGLVRVTGRNSKRRR